MMDKDSEDWGSSPGPATNYVTLNKSLFLLGPQFPCLPNGMMMNAYKSLKGLLKIEEIMSG